MSQNTIKIEKKSNLLFLNYAPHNGIEWIIEKLKTSDSFLIKRFFSIFKDDITINTDSESVSIKIGELNNGYYRIFSKCLNTTHDVLIDKNAKISPAYFGLNIKINALRLFEKIANTQIIIGGNNEKSIPIDVYENLIKNFPTVTEKNYYEYSRISNILIEYIESTKDYGQLFKKYLNKKTAKIKPINNIQVSLKDYEIEKYSFLIETLDYMLQNVDSYTEKDWQKKILEFILIIYPKYLFYIEEFEIKDVTRAKNKKKRIDIALFDVNGNMDIIEIKKPNAGNIISSNLYRENHIPARTLSGSIMQIEKYLYLLNKLGQTEENNLNKKYNSVFDKYGVKLEIINPKGMIIAGLSSEFNKQQRLDFELIKRKYARVVDIITYDDLVKRLKNIVVALKERS